MLSTVMENKSCYNVDNEDMLRKVTVKIELERIDTHEGVIVKALLDSGAMELVISSKLTRKQGFKLKKVERPIYMRNINSFFNKERSIEHTVKIIVYYQEHRKRMEIDVIEIRNRVWFWECYGLYATVLKLTGR